MHPYLRFRLQVFAESADRHPDGLSATIVRRVLGKALVDAFCPFGKPLCAPPPRRRQPGNGERPPTPLDLCQQAGHCPYGVLFAASRSPRPPYGIHVPEPEAGVKGGWIEITLLGPAWRIYPWVLEALQRALRLGLGRSRTRYRIREVVRVHADGGVSQVAEADLERLSSVLEPDLLGVALEPFLAPQPVEIHFLSPTRLINEGRLVGGREGVPFEVLIGRILDRFQGLFGDGASEVLRPEIRDTIEAEAAEVPLLKDETRWLDVPDYSSRNRAELLMGGKVGRLVYGDGAARFFPILRAGEVLHVGKNPTSGCGRLGVVLPAVGGTGL